MKGWTPRWPSVIGIIVLQFASTLILGTTWKHFLLAGLLYFGIVLVIEGESE